MLLFDRSSGVVSHLSTVDIKSITVRTLSVITILNRVLNSLLGLFTGGYRRSAMGSIDSQLVLGSYRMSVDIKRL